MLRSSKEILGYAIQATDGEIGEVDDFYFDDNMWIIRYMVVDTGGWLSGRKVLVPPHVLEQPDWHSEKLPVELTKEQVENSPTIDLDLPVSRQTEMNLYDYYGWSPYWSTTPMIPRPMPIPFTARPVPRPTPEQRKVAETMEKVEQQYDPHLRSIDEVTGYHIKARDGEIGHVETFIIDDRSWSVMYLVVDTRNWLPGRKVLVSLEWVDRVDWPERLVYVDLKKETIKNSPEFDPSEPVNREYERQLYDYYGRPHYW